MHFVSPAAEGIELIPPEKTQDDKKLHKFTVYAIEPSGRMLVGDVTV